MAKGKKVLPKTMKASNKPLSKVTKKRKKIDAKVTKVRIGVFATFADIVGDRDELGVAGHPLYIQNVAYC